jgi:hypothetical protein
VIVVSFGGGTNSTAMLVEMLRRGEPCDAIVFADTGGEKPETYAHLAMLSAWLVERGYPAIETCQNDGTHPTLEGACLDNKQLPGVAYGFKSCSDKYKMRPFGKWLKAKGWTDVTVLIGFDADEPHRASRGDAYDMAYAKRYPLIEWNMGRDECVAAIRDAGLPQPGKSACFFCPNSKPSEIIALSKTHPALYERALTMEGNAELTTIKGLGRNFSWRELVKWDADQFKLFDNQYRDFLRDQPCGCYDEATP